jgi:2'-5' RNA ligase
VEEEAAEKIAELAEKIAEKDTLRIKFTKGDSFAPGTEVVVAAGEVLAEAQDEQFQVGTL